MLKPWAQDDLSLYVAIRCWSFGLIASCLHKVVKLVAAGFVKSNKFDQVN